MPPGSPKRGHGPGDVLRRKRRAVHAPVFFDQHDEPRERPTSKCAVPLPRQCEIRALGGKEHRDDVAENVADHGIRHCRPISFPIALEIENPAENQQINEIGEIGKLHELSQRRMHQVFEPERRIHAGEPSVKAMSFASSHPGSTKCTRLPSSSKQKIKKRCGYQWRQKCQNFAEKARSTLFGSFRALPPARHKSKIIAATSAWVETSRTGWARFSANSATSMLENPKYPSAIHSNAPHLEEASAKILAISVTSPTRSGGGVHAMALSWP